MAEKIEFVPEGEEQEVHDVSIGDGELMIPDWDKFAEKFPCLAAMNREGQLYLLTESSAGQFVAINELAKRKERKLKAAT